MSTVDLKGNSCTACGYRFEAATGFRHQRVPKDGDVSICIECANVDIFQIAADGTISLRKPTPDEQVTLDHDQAITDARAAIILRRDLAEHRIFEGINSTGEYQIVTDGPGAKCPTCGYPERHRIFQVGPDREPLLTADGCPSCETSRMPGQPERES